MNSGKEAGGVWEGTKAKSEDFDGYILIIYYYNYNDWEEGLHLCTATSLSPYI